MRKLTVVMVGVALILGLLGCHNGDKVPQTGETVKETTEANTQGREDVIPTGPRPTETTMPTEHLLPESIAPEDTISDRPVPEFTTPVLQPQKPIPDETVPKTETTLPIQTQPNADTPERPTVAVPEETEPNQTESQNTVWIGYEDFMAMTPQQQMEYWYTFQDPMEYIQWYQTVIGGHDQENQPDEGEGNEGFITQPTGD